MLGHMSIWLEDFIIFILFFLDPQNKCHINLISQTKVLVKFWITSLIAYHFPKNFWYVRSHLHLGCSKWISGLRTRFIFNKKRSFWCLVRYQISFSEVAFLPILLFIKPTRNEFFLQVWGFRSGLSFFPSGYSRYSLGTLAWVDFKIGFQTLTEILMM